MKYVKMLGLVAVAAMALMAFLGAGSASATVFCKTPEQTNKCAEGWDYPAKTTFHATLEELSGGQKTAILETTSGTVLDTCTESTVHGLLENTGGSNETVKIELSTELTKESTEPTGLHWSGCTKTTKTIKPGTLEVHWIAGTDNGTVTVTGTEVTVNTVFGSCVFGPGAVPLDIGELRGGAEGTIKIDATVPRISGLCPETATWTAAYKVTAPKPLYVSTS